ncbi:hypothetical protein COD22_28445 [Bacillus thuringiensis]|nr:hypothetical protein COD22_28445 [Bacillus thuringiensis]
MCCQHSCLIKTDEVFKQTSSVCPLTENGRKSHRYEKKTAFDILDVVYQCAVSNLKQKTV